MRPPCVGLIVIELLALNVVNLSEIVLHPDPQALRILDGIPKLRELVVCGKWWPRCMLSSTNQLSYNDWWDTGSQ